MAMVNKQLNGRSMSCVFSSFRLGCRAVTLAISGDFLIELD